MPPAAGYLSQYDRVPLMPALMPAVVQPPLPAVVPETVAKDAIIAWFRGEFAAANAIIDALCGHLSQLDGGGGSSEYESLFAAVHRRRINWIPILQMQKYFSIADVTLELRKVAARKAEEREEEAANQRSAVAEVNDSSAEFGSENGGGETVDAANSVEENSHDAPESEITDTGSQEVQPLPEQQGEFCSSHENCEAHQAQIKMIKGFSAREPVKGHMVNVVRGLKLYEDIFSPTELSKLNDFVDELRVAGQNGELSGETFVLYNQQRKGNKREMIQLGAPIYSHIKDNPTSPESNIDPIPPLLEGVVNHLIQCRLISDSRRPNGCIISFFDEGEYSQPFLKPPHLDQPVSTLLLSESTMVFGRTLVNNSDGNYRGSLMLSLKEGSLLVMRGNSADTARHAMCSSPNKRVSVTFFRVRAQIENNLSPSARAMTLWQQPGVASPNGNATPKWGVLRAPIVMLPMVLSPCRKAAPRARAGTGVFFPWKVGSRKPVKQLPPRAQKARFLALPSLLETQPGEEFA